MLTRTSMGWIAPAVVCGFLVIFLLQFRHASFPNLRYNTVNAMDEADTVDPANTSLTEQHGHTRNLNDTHNSTLGFQKVFAINLPARTDKRDALVLSSKLTGFSIDFAPGVDPSTIQEKTLPHKYISEHPERFEPGAYAAWRAHVNTIEQIVENDLETVLIMEDDMDWDVRLKSQLRDFAVMSNAMEETSDSIGQIDFDSIDLALTDTAPKSSSPYGDDWDVLWLGHCGQGISENYTYVVRTNDQTVPELEDVHMFMDMESKRLKPYPDHTRIAMTPLEATCTYAYAVTKKAARQILLDLGLERINAAFDLMLREWCEGAFAAQGPPRKCFGISPPLFDMHRRAGMKKGESDIHESEIEDGFREEAETFNIRQSVRKNLKALLDGGGNIADSYPDKVHVDEDRMLPNTISE